MTEPQFASLDEWNRWLHRRQSPLRRLRGWLHRSAAEPLVVKGVRCPEVLVATDSLGPSSRAALLELGRVAARHWEVSIAFPSRDGNSPSAGNGSRIDLDTARLRVVVAGGDYMPVGAWAREVASSVGVPYVVVQHGLLTPFVPPLPDGAHLLPWSETDGEYWASTADGVRVVPVGSQLLWQAAQAREWRARTDRIPSNRLTFLGQLHGAELDREVTVGTVASLAARGWEIDYRPHPAERDRRSRAQHRRWKEAPNVTVRDGGLDLRGEGPVVALFSTGILEAAAAGRDAFGVCDGGPSWVRELWKRYGIAELGEPSATRVSVPEVEPALLAVEALRSLI